MQGIWVNGHRPKTKKEIKEMVALNPIKVTLEATSVFKDEFGGSVVTLPNGTYFFVGPNPYTDRKFYGQIIVKDGRYTVK